MSPYGAFFTCRQVATVLPSPPVRTPLPSWDHHLRVTLCHVTHRTRDVVMEQVSGVVGLKTSRQVMCQIIETSIATESNLPIGSLTQAITLTMTKTLTLNLTHQKSMVEDRSQDNANQIQNKS